MPAHSITHVDRHFDVAPRITSPFKLQNAAVRSSVNFQVRNRSHANVGMIDFSVFDSDKVVRLSREEFLRFREIATAIQQTRLNTGNLTWDFWLSDDAKHVYAFREDSGQYAGVKTRLLDPTNYEPFAEQMKKGESFMKSLQHTHDLLWLESGRSRSWINITMAHYGFPMKAVGFNDDSFELCDTDERLIREVGRQQNDWRAFVRGNLCFINNNQGKYLIIKDKTIVADDIDLRRLVGDGRESHFVRLLNNLRRYGQLDKPARGR